MDYEYASDTSPKTVHSNHNKTIVQQNQIIVSYYVEHTRNQS